MKVSAVLINLIRGDPNTNGQRRTQYYTEYVCMYHTRSSYTTALIHSYIITYG